MGNRRRHGQHWTTGNPFVLSNGKLHPAFAAWWQPVKHMAAAEPFAGQGDLCRHLPSAKWQSLYDIRPQDLGPGLPAVKRRDILNNPPKRLPPVVITNPPWLSAASAARRGMVVDMHEQTNLAWTATATILSLTKYAAIVLPASFLTSAFFWKVRHRLTDIIELDSDVFARTTQPACLALFVPAPSAPTKAKSLVIWRGARRVGTYSHLARMAGLRAMRDITIVFNCPDGQIGLVGLDGEDQKRIRFVQARAIRRLGVKPTSRHSTRIKLHKRLTKHELRRLLDLANRVLASYRLRTCDVLLPASHSRRKDGKYRRRLPFYIARLILSAAAKEIGLTG